MNRRSMLLGGACVLAGGEATFSLMSAELNGERCDVCRQGGLMIGPAWFLALRRTVLTQNPASEPLGEAMFDDHMLHAGAATRGAQKFSWRGS